MPTLKHSNCLALQTKDAIAQTARRGNGEGMGQNHVAIIFRAVFSSTFQFHGKRETDESISDAKKQSAHFWSHSSKTQKTRGAQSEAYENGTVKNGSYATLKHITVKMKILSALV